MILRRYYTYIIFFSLIYSDDITLDKYKNSNRSIGKITASIDRKYGDHSGNRVLTRIGNWGGIGDAGSSFSGVYPIGSGYAYFYEFTPVVAASIVDTNGIRRHLVSDGVVASALVDDSPEGVPWGFEPLPGYANPNQEYLAMSDKEDSWPDSWPNRDDDWNGYWNGQYGKYTRADQESYFVMDDYYNKEIAFWPDENDTSDEGRRGLGVEIESRGYQWNHPAAEDIIIMTYWITNVGTNTLDSVVFGMYGDADVGGSSDFSDDDAYFDTDLDMVFQWDHDGWSNSYGGFKPIYFGWCFLESPGNPYDGIDNDGDGMIDESQFNGIDDDGDWDIDRDDIGSDGLAPYHINYTGPDADGTEGNGLADIGEPNYEITDNDESDQIGLTSFYADPFPSINLYNDEVMWNQLKPGTLQTPGENLDQTFLYGSGYISLQPGEKKKFSVAMVFGENMADIIRNANTMQKIYDNDYNFAKPPLKPTLTAVPGDNQITLYWNDFSELSMDPIYGTDFEGYRIYRSTDAGFIDAYTITDAYGNITFKEPLAIFDLDDELKGPHPIAFNGVQFDMGEDTGIQYQYIDSSGVINGQTYYYAVTAYDKGYDLDFYELGYSERDNLQPIAPSECSITLDLDYKGNVINLSENAAIVIPNATALGYVPPNTIPENQQFIKHLEGYGSGEINIEVVDPYAVPDSIEYNIVFDTLDTSEKIVFSIRKQKWVDEILLIKDSIARASNSNIHSMIINSIDTTLILFDGSDTIFNDTTIYDTIYPVLVSSIDGTNEYVYGTDYTIDKEIGFFNILNNDLLSNGEVLVRYRYFPIYQLEDMNGGFNNPVFDGMKIVIQDSDIGLNEDSTRWTTGETNYTHTVDALRDYPSDFELQFLGDVSDTILIGGDTLVDDYGTKVPFLLVNTTQNNQPPFRIFDNPPRNGKWDPDERIRIQPYPNDDSPLIVIQFFQDSLDITEIIIAETTEVDTGLLISETVLYDTTITPVIHPDSGDVFKVAIDRPFSWDDIYSFTSIASKIDPSKAKENLNKIAVVPNPYVVAASWEARHIYQSGRGPRKIDFINLPSKCTIKIFTLSGYLVDTIYHNDVYENGSESWNLLSKDGLEIAYGVYIYHVDAEGLGETTGKFAVIK